MFRTLRHRACEPAEPNPELEHAANELLRASLRSQGRGVYPFHTERWLREQRQAEERSGTTPGPGSSELRRLSELLDVLIAETSLSEGERAALQLARQGLTPAAISRRLGRPRMTVHRSLSRAIERLRQRVTAPAANGHRETTIAQAYHELVSAPLYTRERHCAAGREACRADGVCRCRWYLYHEEPGV